MADIVIMLLGDGRENVNKVRRHMDFCNILGNSGLTYDQAAEKLGYPLEKMQPYIDGEKAVTPEALEVIREKLTPPAPTTTGLF